MKKLKEDIKLKIILLYKLFQIKQLLIKITWIKFEEKTN
jgi:hypothetical protein